MSHECGTGDVRSDNEERRTFRVEVFVRLRCPRKHIMAGQLLHLGKVVVFDGPAFFIVNRVG